MFKTMKTATKILGAFALVLVMTGALAAVSYVETGSLTEIVENYAKRKLPGTSALWTMRQAETGVRADASVASNPLAPAELREDGAKRLGAALERFAGARKAYAALPHGAKTTALLKEVEPLADAWLSEVSHFQSILGERQRLGWGADPKTAAELDRKLAHEYDGVYKFARPVADGVNKLIEQTAEDAKALDAEAAATEHGVQVALVVAVLAIALVLGLVGWALARSVGGVIRALVAEASQMTAAVEAGRLAHRGDPNAVSAEFRPVVEGVNRTLDAYAKPVQVAAEYVDRISKGDLPPKITDEYKGDFDLLKRNLNRAIDAVQGLVADATMLAKAAVEGRLKTRADASKHQGDFAKVVAGVNETLDAVLKPVEESAKALERLSQRDLRARVSGSYQGDHAKIAEALNRTAQALHEAMAQVAQSVEQVSSASSQIAASSQSVASGASEQASSLEETSASLQSMASMTRHAADSAQQAAGLAGTAKGAATEGSAAMEQMTSAMGKIKASAEGTSQIIKEVNEIAFQTNLLALNAAVEAARAGEAGRGFAVVAEEVRSLALRSKEAASKTEELIRQSVKEAGEGEVTAKHVNEKLAEIVGSVSKVTEIVAEIAASAKEQAAGIEQVTTAVGQMDKVTQQNAANSEESSSAATELAGQAQELAAMVGTFQMEQGSTVKPAAQAKARSQVQAAPRPKALAAPKAAPRKPGAGAPPKPEDAFPLDGDEVSFKEF